MLTEEKIKLLQNFKFRVTSFPYFVPSGEGRIMSDQSEALLSVSVVAGEWRGGCLEAAV